jgi:hypothetical protein
MSPSRLQGVVCTSSGHWDDRRTPRVSGPVGIPTADEVHEVRSTATDSPGSPHPASTSDCGLRLRARTREWMEPDWLRLPHRSTRPSEPHGSSQLPLVTRSARSATHDLDSADDDTPREVPALLVPQAEARVDIDALVEDRRGNRSVLDPLRAPQYVLGKGLTDTQRAHDCSSRTGTRTGPQASLSLHARSPPRLASPANGPQAWSEGKPAGTVARLYAMRIRRDNVSPSESLRAVSRTHRPRATRVSALPPAARRNDPAASAGSAGPHRPRTR